MHQHMIIDVAIVAVQVHDGIGALVAHIGAAVAAAEAEAQVAAAVALHYNHHHHHHRLHESINIDGETDNSK